MTENRTPGAEIESAEEVYEVEIVEEGHALQERPQTIEEYVALWKLTRRRSEDTLWKLAAIASDLAGSYERGAVAQFADQVGYALSRIYQLSKVWRLRASMPEHASEVGTLANGRELTIQHFYEASLDTEPQKMLRKAVEKSYAATQIRREVSSKKSYNRQIAASRQRRAIAGAPGPTAERDEALKRERVENEQARELGENLRSLRNRKRLTHNDIARATGIHRDRMASYEVGLALPELRDLAKLCGLFEVTMDQVAGHLVPVPNWRNN